MLNNSHGSYAEALVFLDPLPVVAGLFLNICSPHFVRSNFHDNNQVRTNNWGQIAFPFHPDNLSGFERKEGTAAGTEV